MVPLSASDTCLFAIDYSQVPASYAGESTNSSISLIFVGRTGLEPVVKDAHAYIRSLHRLHTKSFCKNPRFTIKLSPVFRHIVTWTAKVTTSIHCRGEHSFTFTVESNHHSILLINNILYHGIVTVLSPIGYGRVTWHLCNIDCTSCTVLYCRYAGRFSGRCWHPTHFYTLLCQGGVYSPKMPCGGTSLSHEESDLNYRNQNPKN